MWDGKIRLYDSRTKDLPIGLFPYLSEFANARQYDLEVEHDPYYGRPDTTEPLDYTEFMEFIKGLNLTSGDKKIEPRDYQLTAITHALENKRALLLSPTASGKSLIIYCAMRKYLATRDKRVLVVVPTTSLVEQMTSDFADYSKYDESFDTDVDVHKIYSGKDKNPGKQRVVITTWQSIHKLPVAWFQEYGMVIGDEAHNFKAKSLGDIMSKLKEAEYRIGATGTLDGTQTHTLVLEGHFGSVFKVTGTKELIDSGALANLNIQMLLLKYEDKYCQEMKKAKYPDEVNFLVNYEKRNQFIRNLALDQEGNTLVLFNLVEKHGKPLYNMIKEKANPRRKIFFVSGSTDVDDRERVRQLTEKETDAIIVASLGTFSTGVNIKNLNNIIFASPSKSQIKILQSIGRGLRKGSNDMETTLYDIADDLHWKSKKNYTLIHAAERIKIYAKEKFDYKIYEIDI